MVRGEGECQARCWCGGGEGYIVLDIKWTLECCGHRTPEIMCLQSYMDWVSVSAPILAPLHTWPGCLPGLFVPVTVPSRSLSQMLTREKTRDTETPRGWCCYSPRPGQESWRVAGASQSSWVHCEGQTPATQSENTVRLVRAVSMVSQS